MPRDRVEQAHTLLATCSLTPGCSSHWALFKLWPHLHTDRFRRAGPALSPRICSYIHPQRAGSCRGVPSRAPKRSGFHIPFPRVSDRPAWSQNVQFKYRALAIPGRPEPSLDWTAASVNGTYNVACSSSCYSPQLSCGLQYRPRL